jgi:hypothetical protein
LQCPLLLDPTRLDASRAAMTAPTWHDTLVSSSLRSSCTFIGRPPGNLNKYWFLAQFRLRGRDETLRTGGICNEKAPGLHCFVECDGGGVDIIPSARDATMYLDRIRVAACGGAEELASGGEELTGGKDDRVFRLDRVDEAACAGMKHE